MNKFILLSIKENKLSVLLWIKNVQQIDVDNICGKNNRLVFIYNVANQCFLALYATGTNDK